MTNGISKLDELIIRIEVRFKAIILENPNMFPNLLSKFPNLCCYDLNVSIVQDVHKVEYLGYVLVEFDNHLLLDMTHMLEKMLGKEMSLNFS